jgi:hypothetical protein
MHIKRLADTVTSTEYIPLPQKKTEHPLFSLQDSQGEERGFSQGEKPYKQVV